MDPTTITAIYAALVASAALGIQLVQWRGGRTQVKVKVNAGVAPILGQEHDEYGNEISERGEVLFLRLTNRSPHAVKLTHIGVMEAGRKAKRGIAFARPYPLDYRLPLEIPPRDNRTIWQPRTGLDSIADRRMRAVIETAAGDKFESRRFRLSDLRRLEIAP